MASSCIIWLGVTASKTKKLADRAAQATESDNHPECDNTKNPVDMAGRSSVTAAVTDVLFAIFDVFFFQFAL